MASSLGHSDGDDEHLRAMDDDPSPRPSTDSRPPFSPYSPGSSEPLLEQQQQHTRAPTRSVGVSSPLNPNPGTHMLRGENPFASRPSSRANR